MIFGSDVHPRGAFDSICPLYAKLDSAEAEAVNARAARKAPKPLVTELRALREAQFSKCCPRRPMHGG